MSHQKINTIKNKNKSGETCLRQQIGRTDNLRRPPLRPWKDLAAQRAGGGPRRRPPRRPPRPSWLPTPFSPQESKRDIAGPSSCRDCSRTESSTSSGILKRPVEPRLTPGPTGESWGATSPWGAGTGGPGRKHRGRAGGRQPQQGQGAPSPASSKSDTCPSAASSAATRGCAAEVPTLGSL